MDNCLKNKNKITYYLKNKNKNKTNYYYIKSQE